jgi:hypothetical protein
MHCHIARAQDVFSESRSRYTRHRLLIPSRITTTPPMPHGYTYFLGQSESPITTLTGHASSPFASCALVSPFSTPTTGASYAFLPAVESTPQDASAVLLL